MLEVERRERGDAWRDPHALESRKQENWPDQIEPERAGDERTERRAGRHPFGRERNRQMADEHDVLLYRRPSYHW